MQKILACLLSFVMIFTSVTPSLAGIKVKRSKKTGVTQSREAARPKTETPRVETVNPTRSQSSLSSVRGFGTSARESSVASHTRSQVTARTSIGSTGRSGAIDAARTERVAFNNARTQLHTTYGNLLPQGTTILQHADVAERSLMMLADFPVIALTTEVASADVAKALEFYRTNLEKVKFDALPESLSSSPQAVEALAETVANISSLGLIGEASHDAPILFNLYKQSVGTPAEPLITTVTSHALLRLEASKELQAMSEISTIHPELWDGISAYAKANNLKLNIAQKQRTVVDMGEFSTPVAKYGDLTSLAVSVDELSTFRYANAAKEMKGNEASAVTAPNLPEGFTLETNPTVRESSSQLYASAGAPAANTAKVQPLMQAPIDHPVTEGPVAATAQTGTVTATTTPKYIPMETTNALGETVQSWKLNPEYVDPNPVAALTPKKNLNWKDRLRLEFSTAMFNVQLFAKSRYGWMTLTPAAAPLTAEAAVRVAPTMEVVEHVRAAERDFISTEEFVAGPGASHRTGTVNAGGMVSQRAAERTARLAETQKAAPKAATETPTATVTSTISQATTTGTRAVTISGRSSTSGIAASSFIPMPKSWLRTLTGQAAGVTNNRWVSEGLSKVGLDATFDVVIDESTGETAPVTFHFEDEAAKEAFYKRVNLADDEYFVFDHSSGAIIIRQRLTEAQKANGAKPRDRGFNRIFFKDAQKVPTTIFKTLFANRMASAFASATQESRVLALLSENKAGLKLTLPASLYAKYAELKDYLEMRTDAEKTEIQAKENALVRSGALMQIAQDIADEYNKMAESNVGKENTPIEVFKDEVGYLTLLLNGFAEGTLGTMGQAITSALGALGIQKGALSNLPTSAGQFGPAWAPFIGAWTQKYGTRRMLAIGQMLGAAGHSTAAAGLLLGALGVLPPLAAFAAMVGGITVNGVAGALLKQDNPMLAKQRAADPVSASATITDLNAWASIGGMYCYLFLPVVGAVASAVFLGGDPAPALGVLASMFGMAASVPLLANLLMRNSRIKNNPAANSGTPGIFATIGKNLKDGFKSPFIRNMFLATAGAHFMGLGFNSGPGHFIKENISNPSLAIATSFLAIYLTVFLGRKLGAKAMKAGIIGDKALAGLSAIIGVSMGAASLVPGLDFVTRCVLWALAGVGFANWANVLQSIELSRPENADKRAAVSTMYILARTSGMLTGVMGLFGDALKNTLGLSPSTAALYALTMPLAFGAGSLLINRKYITKELAPTVKRWFTRSNKVDGQKTPTQEAKGNEGGEDGPSLEDGATAN